MVARERNSLLRLKSAVGSVMPPQKPFNSARRNRRRLPARRFVCTPTGRLAAREW